MDLVNRRALLLYDVPGPTLWHERFLLQHLDGEEFAVLTPDGDVYIEQLSLQNEDLIGLRLLPRGGAMPVGVRAANLYRLPLFRPDELDAFRVEADREVEVERARRNAAAIGGGGVADAGAPPGVVDGGAGDGQQAGNVDQVWVSCESCGQITIGDQVFPPAGFPMLGDFGLMNLGGAQGRVCLIKRVDRDGIEEFCEDRIQIARAGEASEGGDRAVADDVRTLSVKDSANGERRRSFRETIGELQLTEFDDFPYEPRTCLPYLQAIQSVAESSYSQHLAWVQQSRIPEGSRAIYEDQVLSQILDTAICYDCLAVQNLGCFELLVRRKQLIAEAHSYSPTSPSYEGAEYYLGSQFKHGGAIVIQSLTDHVSKRLQADSQILKERRKLEEAKGKAKGRPPKNPLKGGPAASSGQ